MKKQFIEAFVAAYNLNVACASDEAVRAFLRDLEAGMEWEQLRDRHEYSFHIYDAMCMFEEGTKFLEEQEENEA